MDDTLPTSSTIAWLGFAIGLGFGLIAQFSRFCTLGAIADAANFGDWSRLRMWALALAVAICGTAALTLAGLIDPAKSIYTGARLAWASHLLGGLAFGAGMALASGCASKNLLRLGEGSLKALIVLVFMGLSAWMSLRGLFAVWRRAWLEPLSLDLAGVQTLPLALSSTLGLSPQAALIGATLLAALPLAGFALARRESWQGSNLVGGIGVGLLVIAGWYVSGHLGHVPEHPETLEEAFIGTASGRMESLSFVAPVAHTLDLLTLWSDTSRHVSFGIACALGVAVGAALHALGSRRFRLEGFTATDDLLRHLAGGVLMGFGAVSALGCSIGQGVSGLSTLAFGSLLSTAAIIAGCALTMRLQYWLIMRG